MIFPNLTSKNFETDSLSEDVQANHGSPSNMFQDHQIGCSPYLNGHIQTVDHFLKNSPIIFHLRTSKPNLKIICPEYS